MRDLYIEVLNIVNTMVTECADPRDVANQIVSLYRNEVINPLTAILVESNEKCNSKTIPYQEFIEKELFKG